MGGVGGEVEEEAEGEFTDWRRSIVPDVKETGRGERGEKAAA